MILTPKSVEIREFAQRVERLCDFLLAHVDTEQSGSTDVLIVKDLKEDAADIQFMRADITSFDGLEAYMKGLDKEKQ